VGGTRRRVHAGRDGGEGKGFTVRGDPAVARELTEIGAPGAPLPDRAEALLHTLRLLVPYDGAWLALADPRRGSNGYLSLAESDLDSATLEHFSGPVMAG
jgi:hypothetical protein